MNITELCVKCKKNNSCTMCWKTSNKKCPHFVQKTNADHIRAMSDEEIAASEFLLPCPYMKDMYDECKFGWHDRKQSCEECKLEWLKRPAEEEQANEA